jgi:ribosomal protein L6P/L9E
LAESHATTPPVSTEGFEKCLVGHYVGYRTKPKVSHL